MPKTKSGYARLAQTEEEEDEDNYHDDAFAGHAAVSSPGAQYAPIQPSRRNERMTTPSNRRSLDNPLARRTRSNSGVDIKAINARLERWADEIASKFKRKRRSSVSEEQPEIQHSVFQAPEGIIPVKEATPVDDEEDMTREEYEEIVESVRVAIEQGVHPKLITQGSSGSYFARNSAGKTVAVFKPKDEEPYASKNPKWTKWIHRNLFPFGFGRACLIPNLSYVSEAAAYVLDTRLQTHIVPYTDVVTLSSKSFHYDFWDRRAFYRKKKPFPGKQGSFQIFLKGYKDATLFLKEHPWPDQNSAIFREANGGRKKKKRRWTEDCRPSGPRDSDDEDEGTGSGTPLAEEENRRGMFWTRKLRESLQEQLERLVILDYIMRNTDRGLDNWMIRIDRGKEEASIVAEPAKEDITTRQTSPSGMNGHADPFKEPYKRRELMTATSRSGTPMNVPEEADLSVRVGAIDNSLSWPWKHPDAWRSYPFGWLFLPATLIGQPFSESTRQHFLPLLTSKVWWAETQRQLRKCFMQDEDFKERMYLKQIAVMKGQAWNVVETLKTAGHGPLELTRRARVCVWDDLVDVPTVVPLARPSMDQRERRRQQEEQDEMDISAAGTSAPQPHHDLLAPGSPTKMEAGSPFNVSRQNSSMDIHHTEYDGVNGPLSPDNLENFNNHASPERRHHSRRHSQSYFVPKKATRPRMSYDGGSGATRSFNGGKSARRLSLGLMGEESGDEGDLGYTATEEREGNRVQVVVERLETVKGRRPFFTWC